MKLEEARKRATPGPVYPTDGIIQFKVHLINDAGQELCEAQASPISRTDFPLIAHRYNYFDEVVAALEQVTTFAWVGGCSAQSLERGIVELQVELRKVLAKAREVKTQ